ncbi:tetratricopeptide (TPR) repeat protein [Caldanaerobacter subterraneus subsp. tengcongensis MB4]|uniref:TPR-repeat-containing proteins n=1 Tax=Caldanaerobacter subterraneus subsp. tengcongensis (strain DSM 15242 / JCM 11007 / NBRC 100824 / MB4) TaxID=273068 RepID=Q8RAR4_CALS4|nr:helix-turn-helix domain-containing protein [Caldanaerobacter subterraneus]AAM24373.1 TPR-repeat-containing proteins [Caldanaerobacter subterraneus subsp. tengcongensis MB4]MCS3916081.1 tetratricopeptide (TPR) repeat protein [Caldanaerobacter subterraneus subsp. tengcongensis MB4]
MEFLTPGERVKKIRKMLKMKQRELQSENITRGFISMIESNRTTMSRETASIIAEKFNKRARELGIDLNIDGDYLLMTPAQEAEYYCIQKLDQINTLEDLNELKEIFKIADEYKLKRVTALAYIKIGDVMYKNQHFQEAFINYHKALDILLLNNIKEQLPYVYNMLGACKVALLESPEATMYFHKALEYAEEINDIEIKIKASYNNALCYRYIGKPTVSIDYIEKCLSVLDKEKDFEHYVYAKSIEANSYRDMKEYDKALEIFRGLVEEIKDNNNPLLGFLYTNIGEIYMEKNDFEKSMEYLNEAEKIRRKEDKNLLSHTIIEKANLYIKMGLYKEARSLLEEGIEISYRNKDIEYIVKGSYLLAEVYKKLGNKQAIIETYKRLANILQNMGSKKETLKTYIELALLYIENNDVSNAKYFLEKSREVIEQKTIKK